MINDYIVNLLFHIYYILLCILGGGVLGNTLPSAYTSNDKKYIDTLLRTKTKSVSVFFPAHQF